MKMKKATTVLVVDAVEPSLEFWRERLGFAVTIEVPFEDKLGFVALQKDDVEIMVQTRASVRSDMAGAASAGGAAFVYIEVDDIDAIIRKLDGHPVTVPRRKSFYGADEIAYREPGGHFVCFARHG